MTVENISWSISTKECCRPRRGLNPRPPGLQSDGASNWATEADKICLVTWRINERIYVVDLTNKHTDKSAAKPMNITTKTYCIRGNKYALLYSQLSNNKSFTPMALCARAVTTQFNNIAYIKESKGLQQTTFLHLAEVNSRFLFPVS